MASSMGHEVHKCMHARGGPVPPTWAPSRRPSPRPAPPRHGRRSYDIAIKKRGSNTLVDIGDVAQKFACKKWGERERWSMAMASWFGEVQANIDEVKQDTISNDEVERKRSTNVIRD
ncbi:hypothetical protein OPV22_013110 [Ensete ventricosum]|uniref:Uncharacterized protein n=1 Tax=Ensete ventricosum TaxID=4639 RepID=A0AAV8PMF7_ENSVE|nr:hypothetical protein OPV22_013110 [Ensete ventricosum]